MAESFGNIYLPLMSFILTLITFIITYNINKYFNYIKIIEKMNLKINMSNNTAILNIKNRGTLPVNTIDIHFHLYDAKKNYNLGNWDYSITNTLDIDEDLTVDFNSKLESLLVKNKRMNMTLQEMPAGIHPMTNDFIFQEYPIYHVNKNLDIIINITINYSIINEKYKINKKYGFQYKIKEGYYWGVYYMYDSNYDLKIVSLPGSWKEQNKGYT